MVILRLTPGITKHFAVRKSEWACAAALFLWGLIIYLPGNSFETSTSYRVMAQVASETWWGSIVMSVGVLRLCALVVNGTFRSFPYAAHARAFTALAGALTFLQITLGIIESGVASPGLAAWPVFMFLEVGNVAGAWSDTASGGQRGPGA